MISDTNGGEIFDAALAKQIAKNKSDELENTDAEMKVQAIIAQIKERASKGEFALDLKNPLPKDSKVLKKLKVLGFNYHEQIRDYREPMSCDSYWISW